MTRFRRAFAALIAALLLMLVRPAFAAGERERAIALADEGSTKLEAGDYPGALEKFDAAFALVSVPVFALQAAIATEKSGRLKAALERYRAIVAMQPDPSWSSVQHDAQRSANEAEKRLDSRVPRLVIVIVGAEAASVTLDGRKLSRAELSSPLRVDPGAHEIAATAAGRSASDTVRAIEGDTTEVRLDLSAGAASESPLSPPQRHHKDAGTGSAARTLGWVSLGIGGAGVLAGAITGGMALSKKSDLEERCPDRTCPPSAWEDNDSYSRLRTISTVSFAVGAIGLVGGGVLLWSSSSERATGPRVRVLGSLSQVGVGGAF